MGLKGKDGPAGLQVTLEVRGDLLMAAISQ